MKSLTFKLAILTLSIFVSTNCLFGQSNGTVAQEEYYEVINSIVKSDSILQFNLASEPDFRHLIEDTALIFRDTALFTPADVLFMKQQLIKGKDFKWKSNETVGSHVISSRKIRNHFKDGKDWEKFKKKYNGGFTRLSIPLFTLDRQTCIIYNSSHCGALCGSGGISLYRKVDNKWKYIKNIGTIWIS